MQVHICPNRLSNHVSVGLFHVEKSQRPQSLQKKDQSKNIGQPINIDKDDRDSKEEVLQTWMLYFCFGTCCESLVIKLVGKICQQQYCKFYHALKCRLVVLNWIFLTNNHDRPQQSTFIKVFYFFFIVIKCLLMALWLNWLRG